MSRFITNRLKVNQTTLSVVAIVLSASSLFLSLIMGVLYFREKEALSNARKEWVDMQAQDMETWKKWTTENVDRLYKDNNDYMDGKIASLSAVLTEILRRYSK